MKKNTKSALIVLSIIIAVSVPLVYADTNNPYGLVLQEDFNKKYMEEIEPYWNKHGSKGHFETDDGLKIAYIKFELEDEKGAIVISSGRTESYIKYQELVYELTKNGYSVYMHDHRGQGFSDRIIEDDPHKGHVEEFDDYVKDLDTFVTNIVQKMPHERLFLLAHSMGGGIGTRYIEGHPNVFDAAALSSPMHAPDARILVSPELGCWWFRMMKWICSECYAGFKSKPYSPKSYDENHYTHSEERYDHLVDLYDENTEVQLGGPTRGWAAEACSASKTMIKEAGKITIPVLVLQAGEDTAVTPKGQIKFCNELKEQTGKSCFDGGPVLFEGAKHELLIEADKYRIPAITKILDFYSQVK